GFVFTYWRGSEYQPGDEYTVFEDHTFTAQWEAEEIPPKTGDESVIFLWTGMMVMALVGTGFTLVMKKREEEAE
ncbi:MAG: LPXTG cell wall anchor domain-containing protein, partial [Oscillospiraceae bacterium]|nr:LPXTG cell wall anchor domain-containing protein [Oscillospiraceae bacterium]